MDKLSTSEKTMFLLLSVLVSTMVTLLLRAPISGIHFFGDAIHAPSPKTGDTMPRGSVCEEI